MGGNYSKVSKYWDERKVEKCSTGLVNDLFYISKKFILKEDKLIYFPSAFHSGEISGCH